VTHFAKQQTEKKQRGNQGEQLVVEYLERNGFHIRDRNISCRMGELDIVAEKKDTLAFVEVRMRSNDAFGIPSESVNSKKQRKVVLAATEYCQRLHLFNRMIRFDVASVVGRGRNGHVEYIANAFDAGM
jgi:putative endonuclease